MDKQKTGEFLKQMRQNQKLTQKQLAQLLFVTDKAVSRWETGNSFPDVSLLMRLADALAISVTDILRGERTVPDTKNEAVLTEVLSEVQAQQNRLKQQTKAFLTGFLLVATALLVSGFTTFIGAFQIIGTEPNVQEAQLTLAWILFACLIIFVTVVLPLLAICFAWRIRMSARSKPVKLICVTAMGIIILWLVFYWGRIFLSR